VPILSSGYAWRLLPHDLLPWGTVYSYFRCWNQEQVWVEINDSQSVKTSGLFEHDIDFDGGKAIIILFEESSLTD
jgi:hypothetical protein